MTNTVEANHEASVAIQKFAGAFVEVSELIPESKPH
jgi:hypothetical protein